MNSKFQDKCKQIVPTGWRSETNDIRVYMVAKKTLSIVVREVCNAMCEEYVDEVMTVPSHLKNGNYWHKVFTRSGSFLNYRTIDT